MAILTLYEDEHLLAVAKPAGLVVHPTYRNQTGTLLQAVTSPARPRPSIVGRLDKWTSGIVVIAKNAHIHAALQRTLASAESEKTYLAIAAAHVDEPAGALDFPLRVDPEDRRRVIAAADGSPALTRFERLAVFDPGGGALSVLRCRPATGRRHQIRAHLAARGWPLLGDPTYGGGLATTASDPRIADAIASFGGQALHAWRLTFMHPAAQFCMQLEAPLPHTFVRLLTSLSYQVIF
jgi:23S rRNA pseudouridine1911/1915/1917 synthase